MPPRDDEDYERRRQHIIDGALDVFANKGYEKATTKDIAHAAGVGSPGLIYHYFKDKADLFRQVVEHRFPLLDLISNSDEMMEEAPDVALTRFATVFVQAVADPRMIAMMKLMLGESLRRPFVAEMLNAIGPGRGFAFLEGYLKRQMTLGVLRTMDPGIAARCFLGPLIAFLLTREVFRQPDAARLAPETMASEAVAVFLRGMAV